jgi:hypothetical protein
LTLVWNLHKIIYFMSVMNIHELLHFSKSPHGLCDTNYATCRLYSNIPTVSFPLFAPDVQYSALRNSRSPCEWDAMFEKIKRMDTRAVPCHAELRYPWGSAVFYWLLSQCTFGFGWSAGALLVFATESRAPQKTKGIIWPFRGGAMKLRTWTMHVRKIPVFDCFLALCKMLNALLVISNSTWLDLNVC